MIALVLMATLLGNGGVKPDDAARAQAVVHFQQAERSFEEGLYRDAIREFEAAYRLAPHPDLLFNLAQCHERLGEFGPAIERYRAYLKAVPEAKDAVMVSEAIAEMERQSLNRAVVAVGTDAPRAQVALTAAVAPRVWTWVFVGAAGAGLATGVGLGAGALTARDEMVREQHGPREVQQLHDAAMSRATGANIAYSAAGVAALTAIILFIVEPNDPMKRAQ